MSVGRLQDLANTVAIVGVGETDYRLDYYGGPDSTKAAPKGSGLLDSHQLGVRALRRALDDAQISKDEIDGLCVAEPLAVERTSEILGLDPSWTFTGDAPKSIMEGVQAINAGMCTTVACVYGNAQRSSNVQYGGPQAMGGGHVLSYVYYAPWGMTSQGALYAIMFKRYALEYGITEEQLGAISVAFRKHASLNPNAIMRDPITLDDYLNANYIAEPYRLFDYCLVNDGGVAIILRAVDQAADGPHVPINVSGFGWSEQNAGATQLRPRMKDFYYPAHQKVAAEVYGMSGLGPKDVDVFNVYDSFSTHLLFSLEGLGFCPQGEGGSWIQDGRIELGGELPCNTNGGMLSESYMQSWNAQVELVRQLRGGMGERQVEGAEVAQYAHGAGRTCLSVLYTKGN